ncbi:hypothetical protein [Acidisphaera rubrifaciens]|uniref:Uncharacterized protein n=1 Tax=Acidisphaera rubrifaciens HS-AP3 TaxID=1231350 RepID=A0A0D6P741_9PROT|nr:hypothetical protein [Acidisphaera rubrifaciens]GAN77595.1 hypothetical protein Asru_0387_01 [Acidisphaera rubrifaciens HS-AP3]
MAYILMVNTASMGHIGNMPNPPTFTVKKLIALTPEMAQQVSTYRFDHRIASEAEAIRRLIEAGLRAEGEARDEGRR